MLLPTFDVYPTPEQGEQVNEEPDVPSDANPALHEQVFAPGPETELAGQATQLSSARVAPWLQ